MVSISELKDGMKKVDLVAKVVEKGDVREVKSRFNNETWNVCTVVIADATGSIKLTLWKEQIEQVNVDNDVAIKNGYVTSFKGEIQLNVGKFGTLAVVS